VWLLNPAGAYQVTATSKEGGKTGELIVFRTTVFEDVPVKEIPEEAYMAPGGSWSVKALK
jgi:hypothetical protein